jgi:hypothetical protein
MTTDLCPDAHKEKAKNYAVVSKSAQLEPGPATAGLSTHVASEKIPTGNWRCRILCLVKEGNFQVTLIFAL